MLAPTLHRSAGGPVAPLEPDSAQQAVIDWDGPGVCVVLASPGTGATSTLIESVARRIDRVPTSRMLVVARDRDAVKRLRSSLARRVPYGTLPTITTFHGLAYSLVRRTTGPGVDAAMPRLLSGAEEDARIRDLLRGAIDDGELPWPESLMAASATLGFANDLRAMLTRARELGISSAELTEWGRRAQIPAWEALGRLAEIDADVMSLEGVVDYTRMLELAIDAAGRWQGELDRIWVDDFQEAGVLQRELLQALTGPATATVVMADPDVAAFGFRGGDRLGALRLIAQGAQTITLDRFYRGGGDLRAAYDAARRQPALPGLPAAHVRAYRAPEPAAETGTVSVLSHDTWGDLAAWVAEDLRRLRLAAGTDWNDVAIIARSTDQLESLRRALMAAGVPVHASVADIPLPAEPAVATMLAAVSAAIAPDAMTDRQALELITGPLLSLDGSRVRRLARALRDEARRVAPEEPTPSGVRLVRELLVAAIVGNDPVPQVADDAVAARDRVIALGGMLAWVRHHADRDEAPAEVLWQVWSRAIPDDEGWPWPERLRRAALGGHLASSHDIDAVMALFATAERLSDRYAGVVGIRGLLSALEGQRVAAERVSAPSPATPAVTVMTPHLSVGRSWRHVIVVGAQEGTWPPALGSSSVLRLHEWEALVHGDGAKDVTSALRDAAAERMAEERRLFALALSRASATLVVAIVRSDIDHPSRFVDDIGVEAVHRPGRPPRPLTIDGMVARLRAVAQDRGTPEALRRAAIDRLALLAEACDDVGAPLAPRAAPNAWWGVSRYTPGAAPVRPSDRPVALSGSGLAALLQCPLQWFLSRVVGAEGPRGQAMAIGSLVHAVAEFASRGDVAVDPEAMLAQIDRVWPELPFDAPWESVAERADVAAALARLCAYLRVADPAAAVEHAFTVTIPLRELDPGLADDELTVRGVIDRVEIDTSGGIRLIDYKTARHLPSARDVQEDPQLGVYQLAVRHGALDGLIEDPEISGAALVQLRAETKQAPGLPKVQEQPAIDEASTWFADAVVEAVGRIRAEDFPAIVSDGCRTCAFVIACPAHSRGEDVLS